MITKLRFWWQEMWSSYRFVPTLIVLSAVALAMLLVILEPLRDVHLGERWPLFFGASPSSPSGLLTTVASSMITVAGVVFSITLVAFSLTASQYTSRLIRNFMRDRVNQVVLGVFVGILAYCLVVLRTIRDGGDGSFVPTLAVLGGLVLAFVGIGMLIYFIHHIATSIQASSLIAATAQETLSAVDELFPDASFATSRSLTQYRLLMCGNVPYCSKHWSKFNLCSSCRRRASLRCKSVMTE